ncbi:MAG: LysM peptidoglycan-binding domain-containing protein [Phycisphaerales bacterium]|nr:LysM peptidoglycan-binding domain-containing protein [Phycisphaerales bacterium]
MTRELKLALILGSSLVLVVGVLISDHLSGARDARIARVDPPLVAQPVEQMPSLTAGSPRPGAQTPPVVATPDETYQSPQIALGDPAPQPVQPESDPNRWTVEQLAAYARQIGVTLQPVDELTAAETDQVRSPFELVMGQPTVRDGAAAQPGRAPETGVAPRTSEYTVEAGDTLWKLAARFLGNGSRHQELAAMNTDRLGSGGELRVGTKIRVPASATQGAAPTTNPAAGKNAKPADTKAETPRTYTVQSGDTLRKIATKTLGSESRWKDILEANKSTIKDPNALRVGVKLQIPRR